MVANVGECEANPARNGREYVRISRECVRIRRKSLRTAREPQRTACESVLTLARACLRNIRGSASRSAFVCRAGNEQLERLRNLRAPPRSSKTRAARENGGGANAMRMCANVARTRREDPANVCEYFANPREFTRTGATARRIRELYQPPQS